MHRLIVSLIISCTAISVLAQNPAQPTDSIASSQVDSLQTTVIVEPVETLMPAIDSLKIASPYIVIGLEAKANQLLGAPLSTLDQPAIDQLLDDAKLFSSLDESIPAIAERADAVAQAAREVNDALVYTRGDTYSQPLTTQYIESLTELSGSQFLSPSQVATVKDAINQAKQFEGSVLTLSLICKTVILDNEDVKGYLELEEGNNAPILRETISTILKSDAQTQRVARINQFPLTARMLQQFIEAVATNNSADYTDILNQIAVMMQSAE